MVHLDMFDPTRWPQQPIIMALRLWLRNSTDVVCHATSQHGAYDPVPWRHIAIQALISNVTCICSCQCTIMHTNHQVVNIITT